MKSLLLSLLLVCVALGAEGKLIQYGDETFDLEVQMYEPPLVIADGQLAEGEDAPEWWPAYDALKNFRDGRGYEEWIAYFSPQYRERFKLSPEAFERMKQQPENPLMNPPLRTALYELELKWDGRRIVFVKMVDTRLESMPENLRRLPVLSSVQVFEQSADGTWQNQALDATGIGMEMPYSDPAKAEAIIEAGNVYYDHGLHPVVK
ncbi:hypothetical protein H5P28_04015 [Ruficoccus amylovorans]|uniref:Uncharacterized protein n=1 Tax=Ruficoccus amylovorans TaxID=1804625 RepID=A0A842HBA0_9BACT|nr:hypothetical protein [Ruficoccus amylovorans]MBC2593419.1 hypothetical protein [Ruficoccus amylovorans]